MATKKPISPDKPLTLKQQRFVEALPLADSLTDAAIKAGYSDVANGAHVMAYDNLQKPTVIAAIEKQIALLARPSIATLIERKETATATLRGELAPAKELSITVDHRLKAIDLLNKTENVYIQKTANLNVDVTVQAELSQRFSVEQLEAMLLSTNKSTER